MQQSPLVRQCHLYERDAFEIGRFVWLPAPGARRASAIGARPLMVIPRHPVRIRQSGTDSFIADARSAVFYNPGQAYEAEQLVGEGEDSIFFSLQPRMVLEVGEAIVGSSNRSAPSATPSSRRRAPWPAPSVDPARPLPFRNGPCDARSFALQRSVVAYLERGEVDALAVEEAATELSWRLLRQAFASRGIEPVVCSRTDRRRREAAEAARVLLLRRFRERLSLREISDQVGLSAHHLCRVFRAHVGESMHQYRLDLRLRAALEPLCTARVPLATLALDLGFNSQSHFTSAFCCRFGCSPARFRRDVAAGRIRPTLTLHEGRLERSRF